MYCDRCERESDEYDTIYSYSYKPLPQFHGEGPLYLGLELEINCLRDRVSQCANTAVEALGSLGYLKEDGSISLGFELVTHPMSYEWAIQNFPWKLLTALQDLGCDGEDVGLHVHVSREGFDSTAHRYRWLKFIYRNENPVCRIARRRSGEWASFRPADRANARSYAKGLKGDARYRAINTLPDKTYEMRVFASSLDPREVQAALALAAASVEYTRRLTVADVHRRSGWSWASFLAWTAAHPEYQPLNEEWADLACAC
ncbi:hypothetical protein [Labedaea rhizosphaerae]|uniref:Amidoligase enzyme n=1 Tax=Labedaea rhizosphaerae TaxID=598644 RepID=A0A4R6SG17_LABRH|nr:hypothetical protein [Labedaea rhizosphaerae]TDQ00613.1 hypothetical protein EV186_102474 [Labedaea rhizosphaerae]